MKQWYALQVKPRHEKVVAAALRGKRYEEFLPLKTVRRRWSDRVCSIETPLLPGYTFCRFDPLEKLIVLRTPGLRRIVGVGDVPAPVEEQEIAALQIVVRGEAVVAPHPYLQSGQQVRLENGPLSGLRGLLLPAQGRRQLVVSVTLLQRSLAVEVEPKWISTEDLVRLRGKAAEGPGR
jgi:transcription antitermination factor NusG